MKIYMHEFWYQDYEDNGGIEVFLDKELSEEEFVKLYNEKYAGKNIEDAKDVVITMYLYGETLPKFKKAEDPDLNFKYEMEGDRYRTFKFCKHEINVKEEL